MPQKLLAMTALVVSGVIAAAFFIQSLTSSSAQTQTRPRYLPEYSAAGDLILPKNFHEWVYVGYGGSWTFPHSEAAGSTLCGAAE